MKKADKHFERIVLIVAALLSIALSGWLIMESSAFKKGLEQHPVTPKADWGDIPEERVVAAITTLTANFKPWVEPVRNNKPVPLDKSVLLVLKDDLIYDLHLEDKQLRPPLTNEFLRKYSLQYLVPNVGELDPDRDGFTNLEEFQGHTNPKDPLSHPPVTNKLFLVERISHDLFIELKSSGDAPYQVSITMPDGKRKGYFVEIGKPFGAANRFVPVKFEKKTVPDARLGEKDVSELTVKDTVRNNEIVLAKDVKQNLAEFEAKLEFRLGAITTITAAKGGTFRLPPPYADITYKIIDIQDENAVISPLNDKGEAQKEIVIKKG